MRKFWMIRHGETDWNTLYRRLQGHTDIPLNNNGIAQAQQLGSLLGHNAEQVGLPLSPLHQTHLQFISSDLSRAYKTAQLIAENLISSTNIIDADILTDPNLREVNLGEAEGLTYEQVDAKWSAEFREHWGSNIEQYENLFYPGGESRKQVRERILSSLKKHLQEQDTQKNLIFVSHGFAIRSLVYHLSTSQIPFFVPNCAVVPFAQKANGEFIYLGPDTPEELLFPKN